MRIEKPAIVKTTTILSAIVLGFGSALAADKHDLDVRNLSVSAAPLEQREPAMPGDVKRGAESWVRVNYVIQPDGRAVDPVVVDSVGDAGFESAVRDAVHDWRFETDGRARNNNTTEIRFETSGGHQGASRNFQRYQRNILLHLHHEEFDKARAVVDSVLAHGGWSLYESTLLWLLVGRVEGAEGDPAGQLECYRRALSAGDPDSLGSDVRRDLRVKIFDLEMQLHHYAAARRTLDALESDPQSLEARAARRESIDGLARTLQGEAPIAALARLSGTCDGAGCEALWAYAPLRPTFSFAALNGNVERFDVRCKHDRLQGLVEVAKTWALPESAGECQVFVFGDDGASFHFVEHLRTDDAEATEPAAVARSDVLD